MTDDTISFPYRKYDNGKGPEQRPTNFPKYRDNYDAIFRKKARKPRRRAK